MLFPEPGYEGVPPIGPEAMQIIPLGVGSNGLPQHPQIESFASHKEVLHALGHRMDLDVVFGEVDRQSLIGITFIDDWRFIGHGRYRSEFQIPISFEWAISVCKTVSTPSVDT
jgi:hypothetical protein